MIYLTTNTDGWVTGSSEGIGSVCQWNLLLNCLCQDLEIEFCADPFTNINHWQYNNMSCEEWSNMFTRFFNFKPRDNKITQVEFNGTIDELVRLKESSKEDTVCRVSKQWVVENCLHRMDEFYGKGYFSKIRDNLKYDDPVYFSNSPGTKISVHLRASNSADIPPNVPSMETYGVWIGQGEICNLIENFKKVFYNRRTTLYIHSQGDESNFDEIKSTETDKFKVELKLNRPAAEDLYHMSHADVLVLAKSSYSWMAHLLNPNASIARENYHQPIREEVILIDQHYNFRNNVKF
jgi:hypothetical protein